MDQTWNFVSDCCEAYSKLELHGLHGTVNHSEEYVLNANGRHTNQIEGHWRQTKDCLPTHGRRKFHYSYYLAEFIWRYKHHNDDPLWAILDDVKKVYNSNK